MALADFTRLVEKLIREDADQLSDRDMDDAIALAVKRYSKDRPDLFVSDEAVLADGHLVDLPAEWDNWFSSVKSIEYPIGEIPPSLIVEHAIYTDPAGQKVMLGAALAESELVRLSITRRHRLNGSEDSINPGDQEPISCYAAAVLCDQLATLYAGDSDSTIAADTVDHADKGRRYSSRAKAFRQRYFDELGVSPKRNTASGVVVNLDMKSSQGRDRLTHPNRFR